MSKPDDPEANSQVPVQPPPVHYGAEEGDRAPPTEFGISSVVRRLEREDFMKKGHVVLVGLALLFSFLAFVIMASNKHGDGKDFDKYDEYRYLLAIAILSTLYTAAQALRQAYEMYTGKKLIQRRTLDLVGFCVDQTLAYLLISAASSAVPLTNKMREWADDIFTDSSAASISMAFLAFFCLALSALISGHKLSSPSSI